MPNQNNRSKFVVQKHQASHLHYDFRMEIEDVLKSWAIPKGPSMNPQEKRLAVAVEDHPLSYINFEGVIPEGEYGAGAVLIWDSGKYRTIGEEDIEKQYKKGRMKFNLEGEKLKGGFVLIQTKIGGKNKNWLLIKEKDRYTSEKDILKQEKSIKSGRKIGDLEK